MQQAMRIIREHKLKVTPTRRALVEVFLSTSKPLDVSQIKQCLQNADIDTDTVTVYRTLQTFVESGIIKRIDLGQGRGYYEYADLPHHHHLICTTCDAIQDIEDCTIDQHTIQTAQNYGFAIRAHNADFYGVCAKCQ